MLLDSDWAERFLGACAKLPTLRRGTLASGEMLYSAAPAGRCWVVANGYIKVVDPRADGGLAIRMLVGRGGLFGERPFGKEAFRGFAATQVEQAIAHGPATVIGLHLREMEAAASRDAELAGLILESAMARIQFLERRLLWQFTSPIRARVAATLRDLICFEGQRCKHGHTVDVRLSHQDLADLVGAARPVVSAELVRMKREGMVEYTRCYICVDDLEGLDRIATLGPAD